MADRIVQPRVLASTNPDTYDNLIIQQAQNATNASNAEEALNGLYYQSFSSITELENFIFSNNYIYKELDIERNSDFDLTVDHWEITTSGSTYSETQNYLVIPASRIFKFYPYQSQTISTTNYISFVYSDAVNKISIDLDSDTSGTGTTHYITYENMNIGSSNIRFNASQTAAQWNETGGVTYTIYYVKSVIQE